MGKEINKSSALQTLGRNIKQIRLLRGLSQESLASDLQKSVNFISLLENGKTGISVQTIIDLCKTLKVDVNSLFSGIIKPTELKNDAFIVDSLNLFDEKDRKIVTELINYIMNSKQ